MNKAITRFNQVSHIFLSLKVGIYSNPQLRWYVLLLGFLGGFVLLIVNQISVMAFSLRIDNASNCINSAKSYTNDRPYPINQGWLAQQQAGSDGQLYAQATLPYPPPVGPTEVLTTPAYPPPVLVPTATKTPEEIVTDGVIKTPTLIPLPDELLTLEFPARSMITETPTSDNDQDKTLRPGTSDTRSQQILLILVSTLWVMLGGWVFLFARFWQMK